MALRTHCYLYEDSASERKNCSSSPRWFCLESQEISSKFLAVHVIYYHRMTFNAPTNYFQV